MTIAYSVALCTHNHAPRLVRTLADLRGLRAPEAPWELLVIENGSTDDTPRVLAGHVWPDGWNVRVVREEKLGLSNARNRAIREARGEYLIFIDDDETPDPEWLRAYEALIRAHDPDAFGSRIEVLFEGARPAWLRDDLLGFLGQLNRSEGVVALTDRATTFYGGNFGFRKTVCERIGTFDSMLGRKGTDNTGGEEVDFYRRLLDAGFRVWWTPHAVIHHRIEAEKLNRRYFLDLHYRQGRMEALRKRGPASRLPPRYLIPQLGRAVKAVLQQRIAEGREATVRREMNVAYFAGYIAGWAFGEQQVSRSTGHAGT
jgi:glycosyltransferase involved in cell wall biosynthesis